MHKERMPQIVVIALGTVAVAAIALLTAYRLWEQPPEQSTALQKPFPVPTEAVEPDQRNRGFAIPATPVPELEALASEALTTQRQDGVYTILLVGNDDGNGNTDTIVVGRIDTVGHRMDFVSIPRDTLINSPWEVRKINAVYWASRNHGGDGITELKRQIGRLTGFEPDCYVVADLSAAEAAVDAIGGVWFEVPFAMDYEDKSQDLYIHLQPGLQLLNGKQAMELCRYRSGYVTGDLGRIEMQQQFLRACAAQLIDLGNIPNAARLVSLLSEGLETDLSAANIAFFLRQLLQCKGEDIHFSTVPNTPYTVAGYSYAVLEPEAWLGLLNNTLNPYDTPIGYGDLDIVYRSGGRYVGTKGLQDEGYYTRGAEQIRSAPLPAATPTPTEAPPAFPFPLPEGAESYTVEPGGDGAPSIVVVTSGG